MKNSKKVIVIGGGNIHSSFAEERARCLSNFIHINPYTKSKIELLKNGIKEEERIDKLKIK